MKKILIIDDDIDMCQLLSHFLKRKGFETDTATSGNKGLAKFNEQIFDVVLCDFRLGDIDGKDVLEKVKKLRPQVVVIIITGYSDVKMAVEVMRHGAFDYITKPLIPEEVINVINRGLSSEVDANIQDAENKTAQKNQTVTNSEKFMQGDSPQSLDLYRQIDIVAPTNYSVIIYGESGTGKEVVAKTIHERSDRKDKPFLPVDCGTLSRELAASELFGHVKGSFTGALTDKAGFFETADGGTLFLDEIGNLPLDVQATLLRVIQERRFKRVGSSKEQATDVRVLVASNLNLKEAYKKGNFREDLYHRFNEFSISIPSLRMRKEDILAFANFFLVNVCKELDKQIDGFDKEVKQLFLTYDWPGNLRELRNVVRRASLLTTVGEISANTLPWEIIGSYDENSVTNDAPNYSDNESVERKANILDLKEAAIQAEYETIMEVLKKVKFNKTKAAEMLKIDRKTLYNKIKTYEDQDANR